LQVVRLIGLAALCLCASPFSFAQARLQYVRLKPDFAQKRLIKKVNPHYSAEMRRNHLQGIVKLKIRVSKQGDVKAAELVSGNPDLGASAIVAVKQQWKYDPFFLNGDPVEFETTVNINFSLAAR
jgi:TonB family protein